MTKIFVAGLLSFGLALTLPLSAAGAKKAPAKSAPKSKSKAKAKTAKVKKPATQQHPTAERYTEIEQALVDRGYLPEANGIWDANSVEALKKFQHDQRLPSDGKLGALSLRALGLGARRGDTMEDAITAGIVPSNHDAVPLD